jgi:hypothetical protein
MGSRDSEYSFQAGAREGKELSIKTRVVVTNPWKTGERLPLIYPAAVPHGRDGLCFPDSSGTKILEIRESPEANESLYI